MSRTVRATQAADLLQEALDAFAAIGSTPHRISYVDNTATGTKTLTVAAHYCHDYRRLCAQLKTQPGAGRESTRGARLRTYEATTRAGTVVVHHCWPHLRCEDQQPDNGPLEQDDLLSALDDITGTPSSPGQDL